MSVESGPVAAPAVPAARWRRWPAAFGALLLAACGGGADSDQLSAPSNADDTRQVRRAEAAGRERTLAASQVDGHGAVNTISITASPSGVGQTVSLALPRDARIGTLRVLLNGRPVTERFTSCSATGCQATLTAADGVGSGGVLSATVQTGLQAMASGRARLPRLGGTAQEPVAQRAASQPPRAARLGVASSGSQLRAAASVCDTTSMCPPWLAPTVGFNTLTRGGYDGVNPWIELDGVPYPQNPPSTCQAAHYVAIVFDRQTLAFKETYCALSGPEWSTYLNGLSPTELVVAAPMKGYSVYLDDNTTGVGGTDFTAPTWQISGFPNTYMLIGAGTAAPGTAFEFLTLNPQESAYATGSLVLDADGAYNFQSSEVIEYALIQTDKWLNVPTLRMIVAPGMREAAGETERIYVANVPQASTQGLWLMTLDRFTLAAETAGCGEPVTIGTQKVWQACGRFFPLGTGTGADDASWNNLATALSQVPDWQFVFIQSVGNISNGSLANFVQRGGAGGFRAAAAQLARKGGTPMVMAGPTFTSADSYSLVGYNGAKNSLAGGAAEASTAMPGKSGVIHGTLQRDRTAIFRPGQTATVDPGLFWDYGDMNSSNFTLAVASYQQPVEWPSSSAKTLLSGASTLDGQVAAYRFLSHWLLAGYYVKGIRGPHQDDIHYFFTGSINTWINHHTMDPASLPFPSQGSWSSFGCDAVTSNTCTFTAPGDSASSTFTLNDFDAVRAQLSLEVTYLTNTLQYLVTGSNNMKDIVAAGNGNVSLALAAAANSVMGSGMAALNQQALAAKPVTFSWQSLLGMLGGIASTVANIEGVGELAPAFDKLLPGTKAAIKGAVGSGNAIGAIVGTVGSAASMKTTDSRSTPQPFAQLTTTVGELASNNLQSPMLAAFDSTADSLTSDWGRLSAIGPRVTNVADPVFYAPSALSQQRAVTALTMASAQTFYLAVLPTVYAVRHWQGLPWNPVPVPSGFQPTVGSYHGHSSSTPTCNAFYLTPNAWSGGRPPGALSVYQGVTYPSMGGTPQPFTDTEGTTDFWVIDNPNAVAAPGSTATHIPVIEAGLASNLFGPTQLNMSIHQFVAPSGPMNPADADQPGGNPSGFNNKSLCDASDPGYNPQAAVGAEPPAGTDRLGRLFTTTALVSNATTTQDGGTRLAARVTVGSAPATSGVVYFFVDGQLVGEADVDAQGQATLNAQGLALGWHTVAARYGMGGLAYTASSSPDTPLGVYANSPDLVVAASSTQLDVSYDSASAPLEVTIGSVGGAAGDVKLSCTGLPIGMSCDFGPGKSTLQADGSTAVSVVIRPAAATTAAAAALLFFPLAGFVCGGTGRRPRARTRHTVLAVAIAAAALAGCGSDGDGTAVPVVHRETGTKTVLVTATVGSVSRSVAVDVTIK